MIAGLVARAGMTDQSRSEARVAMLHHLALHVALLLLQVAFFSSQALNLHRAVRSPSEAECSPHQSA